MNATPNPWADLLSTPPTAIKTAPKPSPVVKAWSLADLLADEFEPQPPMLIDPIIRAGQITVIAAPRKMGKSWAAMNVALVAATRQGRAFGAWRATQKSRALLLSGESSKWASRDRWRILTEHESFTNSPAILEVFDPLRVTVTQSPGGRYSATLDASIERLIEDHRIQLLIIDPWARFFNGQENSNDETEAAMAVIASLAERTGVAVVIMHHLGKAVDGRDPEDLWRGASRLPDAADTLITITPHYTSKQAQDMGITHSDARRHVNVYITCRHSASDFFTARLTETGWWSSWQPEDGPHVTNTNSPTTVGPKPHPTIADVVELLEAAEDREWHSKSEAQIALGATPEATATVLKEAVTAGVVHAIGDGRRTRYALVQQLGMGHE